MTDLDTLAAATRRDAVTAAYDRVTGLIERAVAELNEIRIAAGKAHGNVLDGQGITTFGYIGNLYHDGRDDRIWYVFLPRSAGDSTRPTCGGFRTGDLDNARATLGAIRGVVVGAKLMV